MFRSLGKFSLFTDMKPSQDMDRSGTIEFNEFAGQRPV